MRNGYDVLMILCLLVVLGWSAHTVSAQTSAPASPTPFRVAVVDTQKIVDTYARRDPKLLEIEQWAMQQEAYLRELQAKYSYLSEENFNEVLDIMRMPRPLSAKWAKRERELREINDSKEARFLELQAKVDRTPQEQEEFNQLQEIYLSRQKQLEEIVKDLNDQLAARGEEVQASIRQTILLAVQEVAKDGGYALVLSKAAVVQGGEDITELVLQRLMGAGASPQAEQTGQRSKEGTGTTTSTAPAETKPTGAAAGKAP